MKLKVLILAMILILILALFSILIIPANSQEVCEVEAYAYPLEAGIVKGAGIYQKGELVQLKAEENKDYVFQYWIVERGESILSLNGSNLNPLFFYAYENVKIKAYFVRFEEFYVRIIARANISYVEIKYPEKVKKGSYASLSAPEEFLISDKEKYVFEEWKGDISSKYPKITILADRNLNIIAGYVKMIKFIDNEWYRESEYVKLEATPTLIKEGEREVVKYWKIKSLNAIIYPFNSSIPIKYLEDIEAFSIKQYLIKFYFEGAEKEFKIYIGNETINAIPINKVYEIWIDEGKNVKAIFEKEFSYYRLLTSEQIFFKVDGTKEFYVKYEYVSPLMKFLNYLKYFFLTSIFDQLHDLNQSFPLIPELFFLNPIFIITISSIVYVLNKQYTKYKIRREYLKRIEKEEKEIERLIETAEASGIREFTNITTYDELGEEIVIKIPTSLYELALSQGYPRSKIIQIGRYYEQKKKLEEKKEEIPKEVKEEVKIEEKKEEVKIVNIEDLLKDGINDGVLFEFSKNYNTNDLRKILKEKEYKINLENGYVYREIYDKVVDLINNGKSFCLIGKNGIGKKTIIKIALKNLGYISVFLDCKEGAFEMLKKVIPESSTKLRGAVGLDDLIEAIPLINYDAIVIHNVHLLDEATFEKIFRTFYRNPKLQIIATSEIREIPDIENIYIENNINEKELRWILFSKFLVKNVILEEDDENKLIEYIKDKNLNLINDIVERVGKGEKIANILEEFRKQKEIEIIKSFDSIEKQVYDFITRCKAISEREIKDYFFSLYFGQGLSERQIYNKYYKFRDKLDKLGFKETISKIKFE